MAKKQRSNIPTLGFLIAWGTGNLDRYNSSEKEKDCGKNKKENK